MKSLLPSKEQIPLFMTLAAVLTLGAGYYFVYLPNNEQQIEKWKFRTLQNIGKNVHEKILNGQALLQTYLDNDSLKKHGITRLNANLVLLRNNSNLPIDTITNLSLTKSDTIARKPRISINEEDKLILMRTAPVRYTSRPVRTDTMQISLTYDFESFIKPLLPQKVFDQYIVIGAKKVLYESFLSGLENSQDSLLLEKRHITSATIMDKTFGGEDYKLFLQPVNYENTRLIVIGLLSAEHYDDGRTKLPPQLILLLILIFTGILITFPIIKLYQLTNDDRLTTSDALSCTVVCMLMISLLFFTLLKYRSLTLHAGANDPKKVLASNISTAFLQEIKRNTAKLVELDCFMTDDSTRRVNLFNLGNKAPYDVQRVALSNENSREINRLTDSVSLDRIFWMDQTGKERYFWKSDSLRVHFPGKFDKRTYFKEVKRQQGNDIDVPGASVVYVDQVVSWVSNAFITAIAIDSKVNGIKAVAMSFYVSSLNQVKVPPGYQFAMIDRDGKVLYHSDKSKNLNENLFLEVSDPENLRKFIRTGQSQPFTSNYFGQQFDMRIEAVGQELPYYIVIMDRRSFQDARDIDVYSFTFSMQVLLLALVLMQMLILFFATARRSKVKAQAFDTSWLSPKESSHQVYLIATLFNVIVFLAAAISPSSSVIGRFFILMISVSTTPVFLNILMAEKYLAGEPDISKVKRRAARLSGIVPLLVNIMAYVKLQEAYINFLLFEFLAIVLPAVLLWVYYKKQLNRQTSKNAFAGKNFGLSFTGLVFSWMLVANGLPIIVFFTAVYNYDQHLIARYKQLELAHNTIQEYNRDKGDRQEAAKAPLSDAEDALIVDSLGSAFYRDALWVKDARVRPDTILKHADTTSADDKTTVAILKSFHIYDGDEDVHKMDLNHDHAFDFSYVFSNLMKQVNAQSDQTDTYLKLQNRPNVLHIWSANLNFTLPSLVEWRGAFIWVTFTLFLVGLFFLVYNLINRIFALKLPVTDDWETFDNELILNENATNHTFIIALPGSEKNTSLESLIEQHRVGGKELIMLDLSTIPPKNALAGADKSWNDQLEEACSNKYALILLNHFEYNFRDPYTSSVKLAAIEKILHKTTESRIIILSTIRPATLIAVMSEPEAMEVDKHSVEKWQYLMGRFRIVIHKLLYKEEWRKPAAVYDEAQQDSLTFKSQTSSYHYYFSVWQSLSREEKFLLYDLAEDGLVNATDKNTLCLLINKGVVHREDGAIRLFSQGFRSFILSGIGTAETEKIMEKVNDNRNWNKIKMPLALISLAILAFILSSQHETSTKLITSLGALAAVIPTIINFLATMGGTNLAKKA
ncbi:cache domain-containing protein [Dyadobacter sp. CY326]|uniref:cache domain-containing protein n=1 Tax=Dyadobacter sp. CY326 TaxID=2907300 RepID=UPI001F1D1B1A|nr:cache domain-containing protein [Dyadobacter sp. CY326]MCE7066961.1 cache domain-containing protein [Dyadobacter sp. CY326]